ncbi:MAG: hypothetical protein ABSF78_02455 [Candidatus Acidiferrales bacterium]
MHAVACWVLALIGLMGQPAPAQTEGSSQPAAAASADSAKPVLDFEYFRTKVQPIFLAKRPGHARCISCHMIDERLHPHLVMLPPGATMWDEEASRKNFQEYSRVVIPGSLKSPLLRHPLVEEAGGDGFHSGGKHFNSQQDPEWLNLKAWVFGAKG